MDNIQICSIGEKFIDLVREVFPKNSEFSHTYDDDTVSYVCRICWKLNNDKDRPNKRSKIIIIVITLEAIEDYKDSSNKHQQIAQERFKKYIETQIQKFKPDHNHGMHETPPIERWLVKSAIINS